MHKILIAVLIVAVVGLAGVLIWQNWGKAEPIVNNQPNQNTNCVKEGEIFSENSNLLCCDPLDRVLNASIREDGQCIFESGSAYQGNPNYVCVTCGNNICGLGENKCNCPADCQ